MVYTQQVGRRRTYPAAYTATAGSFHDCREGYRSGRDGAEEAQALEDHPHRPAGVGGGRVRQREEDTPGFLMIIRQATKDDIPLVLGLIHEFHAEALNAYSLFCNDDKALKLMEAVYDTALVMCEGEKVVGVIAGVIGASMVSTAPVMQELIWFVSKAHRKHGTKLLGEFEQFARQRGCKHILMVHLGGANKEIMERFYTRSGYKLLELQYIKDL